MPAVIVEVVEPTFRIRQRKRHRRITDMYAHEDSPLYPRSPPVQRPISRAASGAKRSPSVRGSKLPGLRVPGAWPVSMRAAASAAGVRILEDPVVARLRLRSWRSPPYRQRRADVLMPAPGVRHAESPESWHGTQLPSVAPIHAVAWRPGPYCDDHDRTGPATKTLSGMLTEIPTTTQFLRRPSHAERM